MAEMGTILIVDDNPDNLQVLGGILELAGYQFRPALSGEMALKSLESFIPDLILLDIRMPGINGYETCKLLKANERTSKIPVIFISALHDIEDKVQAFEVGGVDYVSKPFQEMEILARVKSHIQLSRLSQHLEQLVKDRTNELEESEARYRVLFEDSPLAVIVYDADSWSILNANLACSCLLGYSIEKMLGQPLDFAIDPEQHDTLRTITDSVTSHSDELAYTGVLRMHHEDGKVLEIEGVIHRIDYPGSRAQILMLQDVTERRRADENLQKIAKEHQMQLSISDQFDRLTGLPSRTLLAERMQQGLKQAKLTDSWMAVYYIDLDNFGEINHAYGQHLGDNMLIAASECMRSCLRGGDTLARIGSDEFVMLVLGIKTDRALDEFLTCLQGKFALPFYADDITISLSASIGLTIYPLDGADPDTLLRHADHAMLLAKQSGKGKFVRFDPEVDKRIRDQQENIELMRVALERREFILYYQPKVDMKQGTVIGAEALIRWQHPVRGLLPPGAFLPAIENDLLMVDLGDWVISEALSQMARWRSVGLDLAVSVNVSALHLVQPNFVERMREHLAAQPDTPSGKLEIEVLETSALDDTVNVEQIINQCRLLGVGFSLDDFGTGYSSLTYLRQLSADTLKIDQSFVRNMLEDDGSRAIIAGVIGLGVAFNRKLIAEGVETLAHGKALLALGCVMAQGYGIARPMPAEDMLSWTKNWPDAAWLALVEKNQGSVVRS